MTSLPSNLPVGMPVVLLVAEDAAMRDALGFSLRRAGMCVRAIGEAALPSALRSERLACMVIDHWPPLHDGFAVLERLRPVHASAPVVLLTERANPAMRARAALAKVDYLLERPVLDDALVDIVLSTVRSASLPSGSNVRSTT